MKWQIQLKLRYHIIFVIDGILFIAIVWFVAGAFVLSVFMLLQLIFGYVVADPTSFCLFLFSIVDPRLLRCAGLIGLGFPPQFCSKELLYVCCCFRGMLACGSDCVLVIDLFAKFWSHSLYFFVTQFRART
jgi:hypothetical protein